MSGGISCACSERAAPITVPAGSNERPRQWAVVQRLCNHSAFNGYHRTPSDYSSIICRVCGSVWRTKSAFVARLRDATDEDLRTGDRLPARETLGLEAPK